MVGILHLASTQNCESDLAQYILERISQDLALSLPLLQQRFSPSYKTYPDVRVSQHELVAYNQLIATDIKEAVQ